MTIKFNAKLSLALDEATLGAERGSRLWQMIKSMLEYIIFDCG